jgi:hypothetical protein
LQFSSGAKHVAITAPVVIEAAGIAGVATLTAARSRAENTLRAKHPMLINC